MSRDADLEAFGRAVRRWRTAKGLSQEELADRAGVHRNYIGLIERGERNASVKILFQLSRALSIKAAELLSDGT